MTTIHAQIPHYPAALAEETAAKEKKPLSTSGFMKYLQQSLRGVKFQREPQVEQL